MSFSAQKATPFEVSDEALNKIVNLKTNEGAKFFRVYVTCLLYTSDAADE